jgi:hypothetical protein
MQDKSNVRLGARAGPRGAFYGSELAGFDGSGAPSEAPAGPSSTHPFQLFLVSSNDNYTAADRRADEKGFTMSAVTQYRCEMCGTESSNPLHWFMIRCNANELRVLKWNFEEASMPDTRHYCGEAHAGVYISRWLEASCSPSRPDYNRPSAS